MFSLLPEKKTRMRSRILDRKGQGTVEYVLLLVIAVGIILGLMNQFYKPFNKYLNNYMGAYLQCLLDVGELPALGWDASEGVCNAEFEPLGVNGRPPITTNPRNPSPRPSDGEDPKDPAARGNTNASSGQGNSSSGSGRRAAGSSIKLGSSGGGTDGASEGSDKMKKIPVELEDTRYFRVSRDTGNQLDGQGRRVKAVGITGLLQSEKDKIDREQARIQRLGAFEDMGAEGKAKKMRVKPPSERKVASEDDSSPWTFGKFIRLALILMLIIAIILFLGGQALQISKGMDS